MSNIYLEHLHDLIDYSDLTETEKEEIIYLALNQIIKGYSKNDESILRKIKSISNSIEENRLNDYRCPFCGIELTVQNYTEPREYQGFNCNETINEFYCADCGYEPE